MLRSTTSPSCHKETVPYREPPHSTSYEKGVSCFVIAPGYCQTLRLVQQEGNVFIITEFVEGGNLKDVLKRTRPAVPSLHSPQSQKRKQPMKEEQTEEEREEENRKEERRLGIISSQLLSQSWRLKLGS